MTLLKTSGQRHEKGYSSARRAGHCPATSTMATVREHISHDAYHLSDREQADKEARVFGDRTLRAGKNCDWGSQENKF